VVFHDTQVICGDRQKPAAHDVTVQLPALSHLPDWAPAAVGVQVAPELNPHVPLVPEVQDWHGWLQALLQQMGGLPTQLF